MNVKGKHRYNIRWRKFGLIEIHSKKAQLLSDDDDELSKYQQCEMTLKTPDQT